MNLISLKSFGQKSYAIMTFVKFLFSQNLETEKKRCVCVHEVGKDFILEGEKAGDP